MAGPSIAVRVLGDFTGLAQSAQKVGSTLSGAAGNARQAFGSVLGTLNRTGVLGPFGDSLAGISQALDEVAKHGKSTGDVMLGLGGAAAGIGGGLAYLGSADKAAHQQLQAAIEATGKSYDDYSGQIDKAVKHNEKFGDTAATTQNALEILTQATQDPAKALQYLGTAADLAASKHESLDQAATQLGKTYNGSTKLLKEFGIEAATKTTTALKAVTTATNQANLADLAAQKAKQRLSDLETIDHTKKKLTLTDQIALRNAQQAVTAATVKAQGAHQKLTGAQQAATLAAGGQSRMMGQLASQLKGQASAAADTFSGKLKGIAATVEDQTAQFGQKYGPAIMAAGVAMSVMGGVVKTASGAMKALSGAAKDTAAAEDVVAAASDVAGASMLPMLLTVGLIVLAVLALIAIAWVIYKNWNTIWKVMKAVVVDVWDWIKSNWPLLLGILLGPIALAAALIYKNWATIKGAAVDAFNWLKTNWPLVLAIITGPFGLAVLAIVKNWGDIKAAAKAVYDWFVNVWNLVEGYISGPFKSAISDIQGAWNGLWSWFSGLPGDISRAAAGMWSGVTGAFKDAIDGVIDLWNGMARLTALHISTPSLGPIPAIHVDTGQLIPSIPRLAAGGLITSDGLIYAHAGEAISPIPGRLGPAVTIENANFGTELDVEAFMRRVAWVTKTAKV